ncbi:hypothetical protein F4819DRAFT_461154 [Hypoxylon fuscum]|nr:hypothetical protein F4819DRAFT_461154 [Hypoxylon fuscum]
MEPSFPQFGLLPAEIRCKIWRFAIQPRVVLARLKMDMDSWNAATEEDWMQIHLRLTCDGKEPALPLLVLVNHEARHEIMSLYGQPFRISKDAVKRSSPVDLDDATVDTMCNSSRMSQFYPESDVLTWVQAIRWSGNDPMTPCPLFLAACLSVRHVDIHADKSMYTQLDVLALAVLDQDQPLETLTITKPIVLGQVPNQYRLARRPAAPRLLEKGLLQEESLEERAVKYTDLWDAVSRHSSACFLPWYKAGPDSVQSPHPFVNKVLTQNIWTGQRPLTPETCLDPRFAIYVVLFPPDYFKELGWDDRDQEDCHRLFHGEKKFDIRSVTGTNVNRLNEPLETFSNATQSEANMILRRSSN